MRPVETRSILACDFFVEEEAEHQCVHGSAADREETERDGECGNSTEEDDEEEVIDRFVSELVVEEEEVRAEEDCADDD